MHLLLASVSSATSPAGVCRHAANIALGMASHPNVRKVTMLVGDWQATYFRQAFSLSAPNLDIQTISIPNTSIARNLWYLRTLPTLAKKLDADIIHLAYPMPILRSGIPIVVSLHDLYPFDIPQNFGRHRAWLNRTALRFCLKNADAISCVSKPTQNRLIDLFPALRSDKICTILNTVSPSQPASLPESNHSPFILCVAQHRANKNLALLIRAFRQALDHAILPPTFRLVIVGNEGPETQSLQHLVVESHLSGRVDFLRNIPDTTLAALYTHCELFIAPSLIEGFGLPLAEALAANCRIACSDIPAFRSQSPANCTFFDPNDNSILNAIRQALNSPRPTPISPSGLDQHQAAALYLALYTRLKQPQLTIVPSPAGLRTSGDL